MGQYDWLFYEFKKEKTYHDMLPEYQAYFRGERCVAGAQLYLPYRAYVKPGVIDAEPHFHRDEQYLAFVGHDLVDAFESFDAEIELWLGETLDTMQRIVITAPTMVRVPEFYWHGPIVIKRLGKPLFFQPVLYNGRYNAIRRSVDSRGGEYYTADVEGETPCTQTPGKRCSFCGKCGKGARQDYAPPKESTATYDRLIHTFVKQYNHWGDFMPRYQAYFRGHDCMPESRFYSSYRCYMKDAFVDREPNFHTEEEYLCFTGHDMLDPWGSFDAEVEFWIGKDPGSLEKHVFNKPTIVRIPPYTWHCPLEYRNSKQPVYLQVLGTRGKFGPFYSRRDENDRPFIQYIGTAGSKKCVIEPEKQCSYCGRCWKTSLSENEPKNAEEAALRYRALAGDN